MKPNAKKIPFYSICTNKIQPFVLFHERNLGTSANLYEVNYFNDNFARATNFTRQKIFLWYFLYFNKFISRAALLNFPAMICETKQKNTLTVLVIEMKNYLRAEKHRKASCRINTWKVVSSLTLMSRLNKILFFSLTNRWFFFLFGDFLFASFFSFSLSLLSWFGFQWIIHRKGFVNNYSTICK